MHAILQNLLRLQTLEFGEVTGKSVASQVTELRGLIPQPIIAHYDRLRVRGKKGLTAVRNQVCTGCHMHVPIGQITVLMRSEDVQLCESCGRYLYLPEPVEAAPAEEPAAAKPAAKAAVKPVGRPRKRKALVAVA